MPFIHIRISGPADAELAQRVAVEASALTSRVLGKDPALTAVAVDFIPAACWFIAGHRLTESAPRSYHWQVAVTDETNTKREKASYLEAVHRTMGALLGGVAEHSYAHVADLRAGAYGYGGRTQEARFQHPA